MSFPFSKPLEDYTNDELISLFVLLYQKLSAILSEGRKRQVFYFLREHEQMDLINEIFNKEDREQSNDNSTSS